MDISNWVAFKTTFLSRRLVNIFFACSFCLPCCSRHHLKVTVSALHLQHTWPLSQYHLPLVSVLPWGCDTCSLSAEIVFLNALPLSYMYEALFCYLPALETTSLHERNSSSDSLLLLHMLECNIFHIWTSGISFCNKKTLVPVANRFNFVIFPLFHTTFLQTQVHTGHGMGENQHHQRSGTGLIPKYILEISVNFLGQISVEKGTVPFHLHWNTQIEK